jgi:hypothetical protein
MPAADTEGSASETISREAFVQQRAEAAGRLFDEIDTSRTGLITRAQLRAYQAERRGQSPARGPRPQRPARQQGR